MELFEISPSAPEDLFAIWDWFATDSVVLADRMESEFYALFETIGRTLGWGMCVRI
jgi:plasmid stabilization system protein ParE